MLIVARSVPIIIAAMVASVGPAMTTPTTFAQFIPQDGATQQGPVSASGNTPMVPATESVEVTFSDTLGLPLFGPELATSTLTVYSSERGNCGVPSGPGYSFVQPGRTGTSNYVVSNFASDANLVSDTFTVTTSPPITGARTRSQKRPVGRFDARATAYDPEQFMFLPRYTYSVSRHVDASFIFSSLIPDFSHDTATAHDADPYPDPLEVSGSGTFSSNTILAQPSSDLTILELQGGGLLAIGIMRRRKA
jgi:hypothetical protein